MTASTNVSTHLFWVISRGAGTTAMILASAAVGVGLTIGGRMLRGGTGDRRAYHEVLAIAVMVSIAVHGLALLGDSYLHPSVIDVAVPFTLSYKTIPTSIGIIAGWGLICLGLSYYIRRRIGAQRWRLIHRFTALAWILGLVHTFTEGSDRGQLWFIALILATATPALVLLIARIAGLRLGARGGAQGPPTRGDQQLAARGNGQRRLPAQLTGQAVQ
jgi:methionine sulfoxide reductase heme-binding subunit